ncbi:uncharacterized protein NFIA_053320 [Aspergillus fischeri NRRL 181]|uniref:Uncharacterized protein n=1 Tax=Neosartorya fischeri (strain ATCC 1020 / DSM 3700 / CBS 544.65 / FGSC A1164 / JCM 1740 / NRRL 181 / WB 181) TaxID=331117 RepID=A1DMG5_NEOFI|nr:conserved hypothetical protein [Aspergillus fischeri NRRL 181]EAW15986.1 conserved hypothetical protein [Aspergillus fischeri NRRL 181]
MAVVSNMSEGGNEPQEDPISEELYQFERERQQAERDHDIRETRSNRTQRQEEDAPWLMLSVDEHPNPYSSEQSSDFDLYSVREPIGSARGRIPPPPTGPPPPYPYDEEVELSRGLSRGSNSNGETRSRRFWNRLRRPERRAPPVDSVPRQITRQTGQQAPAASDAVDPPPYFRFEPSGQNHGEDDSDLEEFAVVVRALAPGHDRALDEFCQLMNAGRAELRAQSHQPAPAQNLADDNNYSDFSQYFQFVSTERRPESNQPAAAQNPADNDIYSDFSQYFQLLNSEQHPESDHNEPGESAIEDLQGDPELPPYSPNEEYTGQLEVDPWDGQDPWDFYLAAIEAGQNPPEGQPRTFPDLLEVHDEWLRTIERNRAPVNRAAP